MCMEYECNDLLQNLHQKEVSIMVEAGESSSDNIIVWLVGFV